MLILINTLSGAEDKAGSGWLSVRIMSLSGRSSHCVGYSVSEEDNSIESRHQCILPQVGTRSVTST